MLCPLSDLQPDPTPLHHKVNTTALGDHLLFVGCCKLVNNTTFNLQDKVESIVFQGLQTDLLSSVAHMICEGRLEGVAKNCCIRNTIAH